MIAWFFSSWLVAHAQGGPPPGWTEVPLPPDPASADEVVVYGSAAIRRAREEVILAFEAQGWRLARRGDDGDLWFRGPEGWMGSAVFLGSGAVTFRSRLVSLEPVEVLEGPPTDGMEALETRQGIDTTTRGGIQGPASKRKVEGVRAAVLQKVDPALRKYQAVINETALRASLQTLPDRLDRLWRDGAPLEGGAPLTTSESRRLAILEYWGTRAMTREGDLTANVVEDWCRATWAGTPSELSPADVERVRARRAGDSRPSSP